MQKPIALKKFADVHQLDIERKHVSLKTPNRHPSSNQSLYSFTELSLLLFSHVEDFVPCFNCRACGQKIDYNYVVQNFVAHLIAKHGHTLEQFAPEVCARALSELKSDEAMP